MRIKWNPRSNCRTMLVSSARDWADQSCRIMTETANPGNFLMPDTFGPKNTCSAAQFELVALAWLFIETETYPHFQMREIRVRCKCKGEPGLELRPNIDGELERCPPR